MNNVSNLVSSFLIDCEVRGLTKSSIKGYREKLGTYFKNYDWSQDDINRFIIDSRRRGLHTATINCYLRSLKAYGNYLGDEIQIKLLKQEDIVKEIYTDDEIRRLIIQPKSKNFIEFKTWALICFLTGTGARLGTALEIKVEDVDFENSIICFRHMKNHKQQYFPMSKSLKKVLYVYISVRGDSGYLFCNTYGEKADMRTVQRQIADYNHSRNVNKTSAHLFRHSFAASYIRHGGDIYRLQHLLGHQTLEMSAHYVHLYGNDYAQRIDELSLLDCCTKSKIKMG